MYVYTFGNYTMITEIVNFSLSDSNSFRFQFFPIPICVVYMKYLVGELKSFILERGKAAFKRV